MEKTYQIPPKRSCSAEERKIFWQQVIGDQIASGMKMAKFCRQHQLSVSALKCWKRNLLSEGLAKTCATNKNTNAKINFVPVQVAVNDISQETDSKRKQKEQWVKINIEFRNGHSIMISTNDSSKILPTMILQVSSLS